MPREHDRNGGPVGLPCVAYAHGACRTGSAAPSRCSESPVRVMHGSMALVRMLRREVGEVHSPAVRRRTFQ
ncbi:hypothetical protein APS67_003452 [Streptomyces sp. AVP053U2]|nr:hypothetical protein APS67_003452 [Streptomyces sp. AVP053U2]